MESWIIPILDLFGTAVFAVTGAVQGVRSRLDVFGVTVLACCVGVGGGMLRDCIIGSVPVAALTHEYYILTCIAVGLIAFRTAPLWFRRRYIIRHCDAVGLGVFTALGAEKGAAAGLGFTGIVLSGVFTAIGGGMLRDVLTGKVPVVLKSDFYATAALIGGAVNFILLRLEVPFPIRFLCVAGLVTSIRMLAIRYHLKLPAVGRRRP